MAPAATPEKASVPTVGAFPPKFTLARRVASRNALLPIEVTLSGMVMLVRRVVSRNAELPIEVTLFGMVTLVRPVAP